MRFIPTSATARRRGGRSASSIPFWAMTASARSIGADVGTHPEDRELAGADPFDRAGERAKQMRSRTVLLLVYVFTSVPQIHAQGAAVSPISLVGKWSGTEHVANGATRVIEIEIRQNLRFAGSAAVHGKVYWTYGGTWALKDNQILWHYGAS